jgi:hypothetical protein
MNIKMPKRVSAPNVKSTRGAEFFTQMLEGSLRVGSRAPLDDVPPWVTLEVATGGFATGRLMANGPLLEHERCLASEHGLAVGEDDRVSLNRYFLSDDGLSGERDDPAK